MIVETKNKWHGLLTEPLTDAVVAAG